MSERQLAVVCHCNSLVDCVSKSSLTLFLQTGRHITFLRRREREEVVWSLSHSLSFQMQLSAPHGSIVILGGSRLFWIVCEAQWVTESTFTLTHACDIINLGSVLSSRTHTHAHTHTHTHTHACTHATGADKHDTQKNMYAHRQVHTQHAQGPDKQSLLLGWAPLLSSTEQNSQGSGLEEGTQCVSTLSPAKVSVSGDGSSQQLARLDALCMPTPSRWLFGPARNL